jgi:hypothetical protein
MEPDPAVVGNYKVINPDGYHGYNFEDVITTSPDWPWVVEGLANGDIEEFQE